MWVGRVSVAGGSVFLPDYQWQGRVEFSGTVYSLGYFELFYRGDGFTLPALFPTRIRYSALASSFNIAVIMAGLTPTIAAALVDSTSICIFLRII